MSHAVLVTETLRGRESHMVRRWLSVRKGLLRAILPILRALPLPVASRLIARIGRTEYALLARLRASYNAAVARGATNWAATGTSPR